MTLEIRKSTLETCHDAEGVVVVVDVLRAFTTAAFAFDRGASEILMVATVEEAFALRERFPQCLLVGEVDGLPIEGFDLPNSPTAVEGLDLGGRPLVLRTTSGTQGVVRARRAQHLLGASLAVANATAACIARLAPARVTFIETGVRADGGGEEDMACADLIAGLLLGTPPAADAIEARVRGARWAQRFADPENRDFPGPDLERCLETDRFPFAMQAHREGGLLVLRATASMRGNSSGTSPRDETVHFVSEASLRERVARRFAEVASVLRPLLPEGAAIEHVGSTAIPGALTKGDLDVQVRTAAADYEAAKARLLERYAVNTGGFVAADGVSFEDNTADPPLGLHLTVIGGSCDLQSRFRDRLLASPELQREYDALKRRFEGGSMALYRDAKMGFVEKVVGASAP